MVKTTASIKNNRHFPYAPCPMPYALLFLLFALVSCTPIGTVIGAGAVAGGAALEERPVGRIATDTRINAEIQTSLADHDFDLFRRLNLTVREGRVLATGFTASPEARMEAARRIWQVEGVKEVINEIQIDPEDSGFGRMARDTQISASLRTDMTLDKNIFALNYAIDVVRGVVYIMGIAQNQAELDRVLQLAKSMEYVREVKSFVRIKSPPTS